jgi:Fe-S-cluster containining protein
MKKILTDTYSPFAQKLAQIYKIMDERYKKAADYYGFECKGCNDNCCMTRFYHHTYLEYFYILKGYKKLESEKQSEIMSGAVEVCREDRLAHEKNIKIRVMCPFNFDGLCILYDYRPMICRLHGIPHELNRPGTGIVHGLGCEFFTKECGGKDYYKFDRTGIYVEMAQLEKQLKEAVNIKEKIKMTVAEMVISYQAVS